jgi:hypothetical protein
LIQIEKEMQCTGVLPRDVNSGDIRNAPAAPWTESLRLQRGKPQFPLRQNNPTGKSPKVCPAPREKIFLFFRIGNPGYDLPSRPERGALAIVTNVGRVAVDAKALLDAQR